MNADMNSLARGNGAGGQPRKYSGCIVVQVFNSGCVWHDHVSNAIVNSLTPGWPQ
jgi:hypothetical protein